MSDDWQPIETAPANEIVLVCGYAKNGYFVTDAVLDDRHGEWLLFDPADDSYSVEFGTPSNWMPLPAPPKQD